MLDTMGFFTDSDFQQEVLESPVPVMVYFTSPWCGPCKMLDPVVTEIAAQWSERVKFGQINILEHVGMALKHSVMKAPTLMLFVSGQPVERTTGYLPRQQLIGKFEPHLPLPD